MATKERKTAIDIDDILLREVASRRSASGSVLDMAPGEAPAAALPEEAPDPEPVRESVQEPVREEARPARSRSASIWPEAVCGAASTGHCRMSRTACSVISSGLPGPTLTP